MDNTEIKKPAPVVVPDDPEDRARVWGRLREHRAALRRLNSELRIARQRGQWAEAIHTEEAIEKLVAELARIEPVALAIHREEVSRAN